ncbi:MAG: DoxX family protein [Acidobacteria bacterium]|nr:DoxX family protein [Acidobacteriota bacterium]
MHMNENRASGARGRLWAGRVVTALPALFLLLDGVAKLFKPAPVVQGTLQLGFTEAVIVPLGILLTTCTILYLIPRTAVLGAVLLTGYLGGAVAIQVRAEASWFPLLFPVMMGALVWCGLWLRDNRLRSMLPLTGAPRAI